MRRSSIISIGVYILYILYGIFWIFVYFDNKANPPENPVTHLEHIVGGGLILIGLIAIGIKSLHLCTGLGIFSIVCALLDFFGVYMIWWIFVLDTVPLDKWLIELNAEELTRAIPYIILSLVPAIACVSNLISSARE